MSESEAEESRRSAFVRVLRRREGADEAVLHAMSLVPRELFVDALVRAHAYDDVALPIACGQTMSQPGVVLEMTSLLAVNATHRVLEIGTGSGYQAAVLAHLAAEVVTLERYRALLADAQARFQVLGLRNVTALLADGRLGAPARAPFDRIMITAAVADVPRLLLDQLRMDGILIAPIGEPDGVQNLTRYRKTAGGTSAEMLSRVRFVPLMDGISATL